MNDSLSHSRASSCSKLPHSHSTPAGVDGGGGGGGGAGGGGRTPPTTPKRGGKMLVVRVQMLDDSVTLFQVQAKAVGRVLFDQVCKQLHLLEADYFGLEYSDSSDTRYWLDLEKPVCRQVGLSMVDPLLFFCVKFYTPDPAQLEEEFTRYLFCLQVKRDLARGLMQCNENTAALMASYIVQAESGDYVAEDYPDASYLSTNKFVPHQDREMERRIMENHKKHAGQSPAEADLNLLETARRCELYGIKMHPAKDHEGVPLNLSVAHMGIVIFQNYTKINTFSWAKIRKISFKRKRFLIKLHPEGYGFYKDTVEFFFEGRNECKNFWKKCVENHGFFRCSAIKRVPRQRTRVLSRGSSFRYSGKTQKQMVEFVRENYVKRQTFQRSQSFRHSSSVHSSVATNVGGSISAHPLLPLGDSSVVSLSCGSMSLAGAGGRAASPSPIARPRPPTGRPTTTAIVAPTTIIDSSTTAATFTTDSPEPEKKPTMNGNGGGDTGEEGEGEKVEVQVETPPEIFSSTPTHKVNGSVNRHNEVKVVVSPDLSPLKSIKDELIKGSGDTIDGGEVRKKRNTSDRAYFIAKEILMTERTYRKDLEVINLWFRDEVSKEGECWPSVDALLNLVDPLHDAHCLLLRDLELRLAAWPPSNEPSAPPAQRSQQRVADVLLKACDYLPLYENYAERHLEVLEQLDHEFRTNAKFEQTYRDFETQKICYLPLNAFALKPLHRLFHYAHLLDRLLKHYSKDHADFDDCLSARDRLRELQPMLSDRLKQSENFVALCELQRDTIGLDDLLSPHHRQFLRQGCLSKFSTRKGYLQRMFFLFSDVLVYTNRVGHMFVVHGRLPLHCLAIEERCDTPTANSFIVYGGNRVLTLAAGSEEEKDKWLEDLTEAIDISKAQRQADANPDNSSCLSLKSSGSSDDVVGSGGDQKVSPQRSNTTVHVCWHRNTSLGTHDQLRAAHNALSGYLLRKFKNSNGWQKLWVVFTNFCLFFYKTFQDDCPLASLPLLGYTVSTPNEKDAIHKDFVFKLQFKNHVYFFRAESEYTFNRWVEVISSATQHAGRMRLFSRKDSALED